MLPISILRALKAVHTAPPTQPVSTTDLDDVLQTFGQMLRMWERADLQQQPVLIIDEANVLQEWSIAREECEHLHCIRRIQPELELTLQDWEQRNKQVCTLHRLHVHVCLLLWSICAMLVLATCSYSD